MASDNGVNGAVATGAVDTLDSFGEGPEGNAKRWKAELTVGKTYRTEFITKAEKVVRRYLDERDGVSNTTRKMNILWANVQTLTPAIYTHPPKPETSRRFDNADQVNRVAAVIMERNLEYLVCEHSLYDSVMRACVQDRLLAGQGTAWVRYEANLPPTPEAAPETPAEEADATVTDDNAYDIPTGEKVCYDYVHWKDFRTSPARTWEEVTWVARRVYMTREQGTERFGEKFKDVPLNYKPKDNKPGNKEFGPGQSIQAKACVWEIWDKQTHKVFWLAEEWDKTLDEKDDIFNLTDFWPCPKPLLATTTTDSIIPVPDFVLYQDQAHELDQLTNRISILTQAVKVVGVYDKTQTAIQRMLTEGVDNVMIPVDNWAMFAEKGGIKGTVDFLPAEMVMSVLTQLIQARNVIKQDIYEITGLADIVRGASVASETATAQNIKAKFANIRISDVQKDIARFASDLMNMTAQLITNLFQPESLILNSDIGQQSPDAQYVPQAVQLIKDGALVKHKIFVSVDDITDPDEEEEKKARVEFLQATGMFMSQAQPVVEKNPELAPMMAQMVLFGVRGFKAGRDLEGVIEQGIAAMANAPPKEKEKSPEQEKAEMEMEIAKAEAGLKAQQQQAELALKQKEGEQKLMFQQREHELKLQFMEKEFQLKYDIAMAEAQLKKETAQQDAALKQETHMQDAAIQQDQHQQDAMIQADNAQRDATIQLANDARDAQRQEEQDEYERNKPEPKGE